MRGLQPHLGLPPAPRAPGFVVGEHTAVPVGWLVSDAFFCLFVWAKPCLLLLWTCQLQSPLVPFFCLKTEDSLKSKGDNHAGRRENIILYNYSTIKAQTGGRFALWAKRAAAVVGHGAPGQLGHLA